MLMVKFSLIIKKYLNYPYYEKITSCFVCLPDCI